MGGWGDPVFLAVLSFFRAFSARHLLPFFLPIGTSHFFSEAECFFPRLYLPVLSEIEGKIRSQTTYFLKTSSYSC